MDSPGTKQQSVDMANLDSTTHSYLHTELERRRASLQAAAVANVSDASLRQLINSVDEALARLTSGTFEGFGRVNTPFGAFIKGNAGFGGLEHGTLNDEDFPPNTAPYSNTLSKQQGGKLAYASVDFGQIVVKNDRYSVGLALFVSL